MDSNQIRDQIKDVVTDIAKQLAEQIGNKEVVIIVPVVVVSQSHATILQGGDCN